MYPDDERSTTLTGCLLQEGCYRRDVTGPAACYRRDVVASGERAGGRRVSGRVERGGAAGAGQSREQESVLLAADSTQRARRHHQRAAIGPDGQHTHARHTARTLDRAQRTHHADTVQHQNAGGR